MGNECSSNINVPVDCIFTIRLDSQVGSTGYSWALACMPDSVNLLDISFETSQSNIVGCSQTQVFTFVALTAGEYKICFNLLRTWEPENIVDQKRFTVTIDKNNDTANELQQTAGCKKFASFGDACGSSGITVMYMSPMQCEGDCINTTNALYMEPPVLKYMAPVESKDNNSDSCT
jgi:predicted secreted protein